MVESLYIITTSLIEQTVDTRLEFENADDKVYKFLSCQSPKEGMAANLPKIQESHKEILFSECESQLIKAERGTSTARATMNNVIELVNDSLYGTNSISNFSLGNLMKAQMLEDQCR